MKLDSEYLERHKKKVAVVIVVVLLVLGAVLYLRTPGDGPDRYALNEYDEGGNESVGIEQTENGSTTINISSVANGRTEYESFNGNYVYEFKDYFAELSYTGVYKGNTFGHAYTVQVSDDEWRRKMAVDPKIHPTNNIVEGYMVAQIVERQYGDVTRDVVRVDIYVDEDFKRFVDGELNITWGVGWERFRRYEFNEVAPNMYMDTVYGNQTDRLVHGSRTTETQFAVGTFTKRDVREKRYRNLRAAIFMY